MQCGFAFMEVGLVRTKNTTNILLKSTIDACKFLFVHFSCVVWEKFINLLFSRRVSVLLALWVRDSVEPGKFFRRLESLGICKFST